MPRSQNCSSPARQLGHSRHELTKQPTPAWSPGEFGYLGAYLGDDTGDLMTRDDGVVGASPLVADGVDIGVTDTGELDVDEDIVWTDLTTLDRGGNQGSLPDVAA